MRAGTAELAFVEGAIDDASLGSTPIAKDRLVLVVSAGHPLAGCARPEPADLASASWVLREPGSGTRSAFEAALVALGIAPDTLAVALELPSNEAVLAAVVAGAGASVLSEAVVGPSLRTGALVAVPLALPTRTFQVLRHKERYRSRAADTLLALIHAAP